MLNASIRILGWDEENQCWMAQRDGEPSFTRVQDLGDAYQACSTREVNLIVPNDVYAEMVALGEAPPVRPGWVLSPDA